MKPRWRLDEGELARLCAIQARLLDLAVGLVRPGGRIVYVTCSLLDEEGADQFVGFLARHRQFAMRELALPLGRAHGKGVRLSPSRDGTDGFFIACAG